MHRNLKRARAVLDRRLNGFRPTAHLAAPPKGWVRAIRDSLGMSGAQLARRMNITPQSLNGLEQSEASETIRLETLRKAAAALGCQLVYALVPNKPLEQIVDEQARAKALEAIGSVSHSMAMEDQKVLDDDLEERLQIFISQTLRDRDLWED
ncbi:MAG: mobile mystery protein A [Hyphomonas sp.]|uniref:mobile mystery protein A n=1 Tax=Hyphomonas sp. TaxID=87 RepID=UPI00182F8DDC|nr:mobile mystery protein A [Hyphomonas sp.]MBA3067437.1 mobile mystery protein A [Hyphomonas sp.]MBU3922475.1 mobile mystery protein A [Alphaproteobacteria bacterium]MBU4061011.1 mobile mystery protein A [Alphaproteobacteria bacterium]MBU4165867.1 mobile mystery protein A [Alphaproteobacteria bacterium]